jgi:hypothetical protein
MRELSMIPTNKSEPKHLRIEGTSSRKKDEPQAQGRATIEEEGEPRKGPSDGWSE